MTATLARPSTSVWTIGVPRLLAGLRAGDLTDHREHLAVHGPLPHLDRTRLTGLLDAVALTGRGGAGFPFATKLHAMPERGGTVVVNGGEGEPASRKDRTLLRHAPHLVLDGALAVAAALDARRVTVAINDPTCADAVTRAIEQRGVPVRVELAAGGFVGGEARALDRGLRGGPPLPPGRREHLTGRGTLVSNAETFAQVAVAARLGPYRFRDTGTPGEPGTALVTVSGAVTRPGVVEIPIGTPLDILLAAADAPDPQLVIVGGYHGMWLRPGPGLPLSRAGLAIAGATFGAGVLAVLDGHTCPLGELARVAGWLAGESSGQCGPCRFGLPALARDVAALYAGDGRAPAAASRHAHLVAGRGACHHPDGTVRFVSSALNLLREEIDVHRGGGGCGRPIRGLLEVPA